MLQKPLFVSTYPAARRERRVAFGLALVSLAVFLALAPFAKTPLARIWAFIPMYEAALMVTDLVTAVLLIGQFTVLGSYGLLVLAGGYLFTASITGVHALTFPDLFASGGLLGAGPQSTAWLYMAWHALFPVFVIGYSLLKERRCRQARRSLLTAVAACSVLLLTASLAYVATERHDALPSLMTGNSYTPVMIGVVATVWLASLAALASLWRKRPHFVLDVWLMVVLCAWLCDIGLSAMLNAGRFDFGFYAGRAYGFVAASLLLTILLSENTILHARLAESNAVLQRMNGELTDFAHVASHDLQEPLRKISTFGARLLENGTDCLDSGAKDFLDRMMNAAERMQGLIDALLEYSRAGTGDIRFEPVNLAVVAEEVAKDLEARIMETRGRIDIGEMPVVRADPIQIRQLLQNLVSNGLKYHRPDVPPVVRVGGRILDGKDGSGQCEITVTDNGIGFDERHLETIFLPFKRLHGKKDFQGTGIGLATVRRIVERHAGSVTATSSQGEGSTFIVTLPCSGPPHTGA